MSGPSNIGWTNATWNPVRGCERVSPGCVNCYAEELAARHSYPGGWGERLAKWVIRPSGQKEARWTGVMQPVPEALDWPLRRRKPSRIFVNSMSDLFHKDVPEPFIDKVFAVMAMSPDHTFQLLTKRPERMREYLLQVDEEKDMQRWINAAHDMNAPGDAIGWLEREADWPLENVWLGVSVEDQERADERIPLLLQTPAAVRWISVEPLLGPINLEQRNTHGSIDWLKGMVYPNAQLSADPPYPLGAKLDWVVVGGESGAGRREMNMDHARSIGHQCTAAGVPIFVKQDNGPRPGLQGRFTDAEWAMKEYPA